MQHRLHIVLSFSPSLFFFPPFFSPPITSAVKALRAEGLQALAKWLFCCKRWGWRDDGSSALPGSHSQWVAAAGAAAGVPALQGAGLQPEKAPTHLPTWFWGALGHPTAVLGSSVHEGLTVSLLRGGSSPGQTRTPSLAFQIWVSPRVAVPLRGVTFLSFPHSRVMCGIWTSG